MKIVMVGDCAHVGYELARELRKRGHIVEHITFNHDSIQRYLGALTTLITLPFKKCDLIHAHYLRFPAYAALFSGKPFVVHCHGSDVRERRLNRLQKRCLEKARKVFISTLDLLKYLPDATYLPTPIGPEFHELDGPRKGAVYFKHPKDSGLPVVPFLDGYDVRERNIPYCDMPKILNQYKYVISYHFKELSNVLSKTSLEALACGCKVIVGNRKLVEKLPVIHEVENVVDKLEQVYLEATEN